MPLWLLLLSLVAVPVFALNTIAYDLDIKIDPVSHGLEAAMTIELPEELAGATVDFLLTNAVEIVESNPPVRRLSAEDAEGFSGINGASSELVSADHTARYQVSLAPGRRTLTLRYVGEIYFPLGDLKEEYTRGFRETAGIIGDEGLYLAGTSLWYPYFGDRLLSFSLRTNVPKGWHVISQGNGSSRNEQNKAIWDSGGAMDEIYLVGGPLVLYTEPAGAVEAQVFLREADDELAQKYLTATSQYIEMYRGLIGPYPYNKFALVENFWETGYGMPSFTLLGSQIIRFPFILTSSYPHEILHNWWGNSVFVDYASGNWAEGLTAYMADHLMKEQQGQGREYRRDTLKKYRDFVKEDRDFPLREFRSRHSAATEAVGYGKTMMGFHMLRRRLGDDAFRTALAGFYLGHRGERAGFDAVRGQFEQAAGQDLAQFFEQWVDWTGAPDLRVRDVGVQADKSGYRVSGALVQAQQGSAYNSIVPVAVSTSDGIEIESVALTGKTTRFTIETAAPPLLLEIDPDFDMFRLLDARETAPSIGQIFGEAQILAVLPSNDTPQMIDAYRQLAEAWRSDVHDISIVMDNELRGLPRERAAWLFGRTNRLAADLLKSSAELGLDVDNEGIDAAGQRIPFQDHSLVLIRRHPQDDSKAVGWITVDPPAAFAGLARKLPHYGKYSYLGFAGNEPANRVKGEWAATDSPLRVDLRQPAERAVGPALASPRPSRRALAELPPIFSAERLMAHVRHLADPAFEGRGLGSAELERAANYIAAEFERIGLRPGGNGGSYFQTFSVPEGEDGQPHEVRNVIAYLPGVNPAYRGQAALITAHYDHLGHGWPDSRVAEQGKIYPGADDNASGVAVMLELAAAFAKGPAPQRDLVFVAFTAEEAGLLGSSHFVANPSPVPLDGIIGVINMDTVGRLGDKELSVFGADSASEWQHIFRGVSFVTGIKSKNIPGALDSSDHQSFIVKGVPGVQISSGANFDYHRPSDTVDKVDAAGLVKVATFVREAASYLTQREDRLTLAELPQGAAPARGASTGQGRRRVSMGTMPDFAYQGDGVRIEAIVPDSPAAKSGLQAGDVVTLIDDEPVKNLQGFTDVLKTLSPGQTVSVTAVRDGKERVTDVTLVAR